MSGSDEEFLTPAEVSQIAKLSVEQLASLRWKGNGPKFYKPTKRLTLYKRADVISWLNAEPHTRTVAPAATAR